MGSWIVTVGVAVVICRRMSEWMRPTYEAVKRGLR